MLILNTFGQRFIPNPTKKRLTGLDLARGIAAYAVVVLHSVSVDASNPPGYWAAILLKLSGFAVSFFFATSFYLQINKLYFKGEKTNIKLRFVRLFIPYGFWSLVYLLTRGVKYLISHDIVRLKGMLGDPISIVFLGSAAVQLYFLPLLFSGNCLAKIIGEYCVRHTIQIKALLVLFIISLLGYEILLRTGNNFSIESKYAFQALFPGSHNNQLLRLSLIGLSWIIKLLPYIFLAIILNHPSIGEQFFQLSPSALMGISAILFVVVTFNDLSLPASLQEISRGYLPLILALSLSNYLKDTPLITILGTCSFGIFLMHHLAIEIYQLIAETFYPALVNSVSFSNLLISATICFTICWQVTYIFLRKKWFCQFI
ncbi:MAG: acyltransferase family protein [Spirulina sp.]